MAEHIEDGEANELLKKPLLDSRQGKNIDKTTRALTRGYISQETMRQGTDCPTIPCERDTPANPAASSTQTQQSCGSATGTTTPEIPHGQS